MFAEANLLLLPFALASSLVTSDEGPRERGQNLIKIQSLALQKLDGWAASHHGG